MRLYIVRVNKKYRLSEILGTKNLRLKPEILEGDII